MWGDIFLKEFSHVRHLKWYEGLCEALRSDSSWFWWHVLIEAATTREDSLIIHTFQRTFLIFWKIGWKYHSYLFSESLTIVAGHPLAPGVEVCKKFPKENNFQKRNDAPVGAQTDGNLKWKSKQDKARFEVYLHIYIYMVLYKMKVGWFLCIDLIW